MKDFAKNDFRDHSSSAVISRFLAHVRARLTARERRDRGLRFHLRSDGDGYEYIAPVPMACQNKGRHV